MNFWTNKTVLITGHTGFKGGWLSLWLQSLGANIIGFALAPPTEPNLFSVAEIGKNMESIEGDIRNFERFNAVIQQANPDIIFHLAAQPLVRYSYSFPVETYATNVMGTVHLLESARNLSHCKAIVIVTSDKCYENKEWAWGYRENDILGGHDPYSNSKACTELVTSAFQKSYYSQSHCGLASARAGNVIGGGDWAADRLIPDLIRGILNQQEISIRYPNALRPWQHVLEPLAGYLRLAENLYKNPKQFSEAWNFGPDERDIQTVQWIADKLLSLSGEKICWNQQTTSLAHEALHLKLDSSKAKHRLAWQPRWDLETALQNTLHWYQQHSQGQSMKEISLQQIKEYSRTA